MVNASKSSSLASETQARARAEAEVHRLRGRLAVSEHLRKSLETFAANAHGDVSELTEEVRVLEHTLQQERVAICRLQADLARVNTSAIAKDAPERRCHTYED